MSILSILGTTLPTIDPALINLSDFQDKTREYRIALIKFIKRSVNALPPEGELHFWVRPMSEREDNNDLDEHWHSLPMIDRGERVITSVGHSEDNRGVTTQFWRYIDVGNETSGHVHMAAAKYHLLDIQELSILCDWVMRAKLNQSL